MSRDRRELKAELLRISNSPAFTELVKYIEDQIKISGTPQRPEAPEWAMQRAYDDGWRAALESIINWINNRSE